MISDIIARRRSIRKYTDQHVEEEKITRMLEAARQAPSGKNTQPWAFIVVRDKAKIAEIARIDNDQKWMLPAPVIIACLADARARIDPSVPLNVTETSPEFEIKQVIRDSAVAVQNMLLAAVEEGLGTCWTGWYLQEEIRPALGIPADKFVTAIVTVGYPAEDPAPRKRKPLAELVHYERW